MTGLVGGDPAQVREEVQAGTAVGRIALGVLGVDRGGEVRGQGVQVAAQAIDERVAHLEHPLEAAAQVGLGHLHGAAAHLHLQLHVRTGGQGGEGHGPVALHQRDAAGQLHREHAAVVGVGLYAEGLGEFAHQQVTLVSGRVGRLPGNLDQVDALVQLSQRGELFVEADHPGADLLVQVLRHHVQLAGDGAEGVAELLAPLQDHVALHRAARVGGEFLPGVEEAVDGAGQVVLGHVEDPLQLGERVRPARLGAVVDGLGLQLAGDEQVVVAADIGHGHALADEEIVEVDRRHRAQLGVLAGIALGVDVGDVVADDFDGFLVGQQAGLAGIECVEQAGHGVCRGVVLGRCRPL